MQRYMWSFDGLEYSKAKSLHFHYGERLRVILLNDTMMSHPVHLHGMWSELENPEGGFQVRKHTIIVQPAQRVTFLVTADALGRWPWHCHLFYHMHAGMFRDVGGVLIAIYLIVANRGFYKRIFGRLRRSLFSFLTYALRESGVHSPGHDGCQFMGGRFNTWQHGHGVRPCPRGHRPC